MIVGGSRELAGGAYLAAMASLRAGAGKLQVATPQSIAVPLAVAIPEARVIGHAETSEGCLSPDSIPSLLEYVKGAHGVTVGCGLQHGPALETFLDALLDCGAEVPLVLDAAVLGDLNQRSAALRAWRGGAILLPHAGEMERLLNRERDVIERDPLGAARAAAETFGAVALLKGQFSHIVAPDGQSFRYEGGGIGLATSGSGDVLAGIVGGLSARGADPLTATLWGVYLHGESGRLLKQRVGRVGFLARELLDLIPQLMPN